MVTSPDNLKRRIESVDRMINTLRTEIRWRILMTVFTAVAGLAIFALGYLFSGSLIPDTLKLSYTIAAACVSSLIGFPLGDVFSRKRTIEMLLLLLGDYKHLIDSKPTDDKRISDLDKHLYKLAQ